MNKIKALIDNKYSGLNDLYIQIVRAGVSDEITWSSLCNWYYGRSFPKSTRLKALARQLGVAPFELMDNDLLHKEG